MMCICRRHFFPPLGTPNAVHYKSIRAGSIAGQAAHMEVFFFGLERKRDRAYCKRPAAPVQYSTAKPVRQVGGWSERDGGVRTVRPLALAAACWFTDMTTMLL